MISWTIHNRTLYKNTIYYMIWSYGTISTTIAINCFIPKWNLGFSEDVWFYEYYYHLIMWEVWQPSIKIWQPKHCLFFKVNLLFSLDFLNNDQHQFWIYLIDKYIFFFIKYWRLFESYLENCAYENINFK